MSLREGVIARYGERLPITDSTPRITLFEGETPCVPAPRLCEELGLRSLHLKVEGLNPTGSFKDRGMVVAVARALEAGSRTLICASTGNTSASAAAYGARFGLRTVVVIPAGAIAAGKLVQAQVHGADVLAVPGNFDRALEAVRELAADPRVTLVNSVNPHRIEGQKTAAFEIVDELGDAPDVLAIPVGNAGNITAYWRGFREYFADGLCARLPRMLGGQAAGAAPLVSGKPVAGPADRGHARSASATRPHGREPSSARPVRGRHPRRRGRRHPHRAARPRHRRGRVLRAGLGCVAGGAARRGARRHGGARLQRRLRADRQRAQGRGHRGRGSARAHPRRRRPRVAGGRARTLMQATIRVPASVANLGPGFDILALALQVQNEVVATSDDTGAVSLEIDGDGGDPELRDPAHNLVSRAYLEACDRLAIAPDRRGVRLRCVNAIPMARGLGSSAAATLSGVLVAVALHRAPWDEAAILDCAASFEGHVDNLAAALLGGLAICAPGAAVQRIDAPDELHAVILAPDQRLATREARQAVAQRVLARRRHLQRVALRAPRPGRHARRLALPA